MISFRKEIYKLTPYQKKADVRPPCSKGMDVMFIIDITGSMNGAINNIIDNVVEIEQTISRLSKGNPYRVGACFFTQTTIHSGFLSAYGIEDTPKYLSRTYYNSSSSVFFCVKALGDDKDFRESILKVKGKAIGGGNTPEPLDLCLREFLHTEFGGNFEDEDNSRFIIFITDATISGDSDELPREDVRNAFYADANHLADLGVVSFIFNNRSDSTGSFFVGNAVYTDFTRRIPESKVYFNVNPSKISDYVISSLKNGCGDLLTEAERYGVNPILISEDCVSTGRYVFQWKSFAESIFDSVFLNPNIKIEIQNINRATFVFNNIEHSEGTYMLDSDWIKNGNVYLDLNGGDASLIGKISYIEGDKISEEELFEVYLTTC